MTEPVLVLRQEGEIVGDSPDRRVEILSDDETLNATWSRFGPGRHGADLHIHREHTDLFYVLDGELTVRLGIDDEAVVVAPRMLARIPPLVTHGFRNGSEAEVRYLNLHAPGQRFADFLRATRDGRSFSYDQHPPPPQDIRPASEAVITRGELIADRPELTVVLLADVEHLAVAEVRSEPAGPQPPHLHRRHVESYYVLDGELTLSAGGRHRRAEVGAWLQVPAGMPHAVAASGEAPARYLNIHSPSCGFGSFLRAMHATGVDDRATRTASFDQVQV